MSRTIALVVFVIVAVSISSDRIVRAAAPTTQPIPSAENAKPKELIQEGELQRAVLEAKLQALAMAQRAAANQPYRAIPLINVSPYLPDPNATLGHFQYNGETVYLVGPLIDQPMTVTARSQVYPDEKIITSPVPVSATPVKP